MMGVVMGGALLRLTTMIKAHTLRNYTRFLFEKEKFLHRCGSSGKVMDEQQSITFAFPCTIIGNRHALGRVRRMKGAVARFKY